MLSFLGLTYSHATQLWGEVNPLPGVLLPKAEQVSQLWGATEFSQVCYYREEAALREKGLAV